MKYAEELRKVLGVPVHVSPHQELWTAVRYLSYGTEKKPKEALDSSLLARIDPNLKADVLQLGSAGSAPAAVLQKKRESFTDHSKRTRVTSHDCINVIMQQGFTTTEQLYSWASKQEDAWCRFLDGQKDFGWYFQRAALRREAAARAERQEKTTKEVLEEAARGSCAGGQFAKSCPWADACQELFETNAGAQP